jgi:hypothetical protein
MSSKSACLTALAAVLILTGAACHRGPPPKLFSGGPLPFGEDIYLNPANYSWAFPAKPGETYRVRADWAKANVQLTTGSDYRGPTADDDDDAINVEKATVTPSGPHGQQATVVISKNADHGFIRLNAIGEGSGPVRLRIDRGP